MTIDNEEFKQVLEDTISEIYKLSELKGGEYAGEEDRLANFRRNSDDLYLTMEQVWAVYAAKHWDAIRQYIRDDCIGTERTRLEPIDGRCDDLIVYLILFKAMLREKEMNNEHTYA